jgi:hypothetical protein
MGRTKLKASLAAITASTLLLMMVPIFIQAQALTNQSSDNPYRVREEATSIVKSYSLKYINVLEIQHRVISIANRIVDVSGNVLTVEVSKNKVRELDEFIKAFDVEKKTIQFRIYAVLASRKAPNDSSIKAFPMTNSIDDPNLKGVLDELKGLWNFKSYMVDGPSFITVKDRSGNNFLRLISEYLQYNLFIMHPQIRGEESGKRIIHLEQIQLKEPPRQNSGESTIINAEDVTLKEKGFLVVGVGGMPMVGAVILIISAEIK